MFLGLRDQVTDTKTALISILISDQHHLLYLKSPNS